MYVNLIYDMFDVAVIPIIFNRWRLYLRKEDISPINRTPYRLKTIRKGFVANFLNTFAIKPIIIEGTACINLNDLYYIMIGMYFKAYYNVSYMRFNSEFSELYRKLKVQELHDFCIMYSGDTLLLFEKCHRIKQTPGDYQFLFFTDLNKAISKLINTEVLHMVEYLNRFYYSVDKENFACDLTNLFISSLPTRILS